MKHGKVLAIGSMLFTACTGLAMAQGPVILQGHLSGYHEVPAVSTTGYGVFRARIDNSGESIDYELAYDDIEGDVTQAHIHLGQPDVNGSIAVFLCTNLGNGPAGTQACPPAPAIITGTIIAVDVVALAATQGLEAGAFEELVEAIRAGVTYVNVHTTKFPGGEVRSGLAPHH